MERVLSNRLDAVDAEGVVATLEVVGVDRDDAVVVGDDLLTNVVLETSSPSNSSTRSRLYAVFDSMAVPCTVTSWPCQVSS